MPKTILEPFVSTYSGHLGAGLDEVGRGPLAGDVVAAAVILDPAQPIEALNDSKVLSEKKREALFPEIQARALAWCVARATVEEIDQLNILQASLLAMKRACEGLTVSPEHAWVDGKHLPKLPCPSEAVVQGDRRVAAISAASILAKVVRDREMVEMEALYPGYGLAQHKGYPTAKHLDALKSLGPSSIHRRSFGPVKALIK